MVLAPGHPGFLGGKYHIPPQASCILGGGEIILPNILFFGGGTKSHPIPWPSSILE